MKSSKEGKKSARGTMIRRGNGSIQEEIQAFNNQAQAANRPKVEHGKNATRQTKPFQISYHRRTSLSSD